MLAASDRLDRDDRLACSLVAPTGRKTARGFLDRHCGALAADRLDALLRRAGPGEPLKARHHGADALVIPHGKVSADAALEQGGDLGEAGVPQLLEAREEAGPEEDLGETDLVLVRLGNGGRKDGRAECSEIRGLLPLCRGDEHVVSRRLCVSGRVQKR